MGTLLSQWASSVFFALIGLHQRLIDWNKRFFFSSVSSLLGTVCDKCELTCAWIPPLAKFQLSFSSHEDLIDSGVNFPTVDPVATDGGEK